ncbi:MAG: hypothetical protein ABIN57_09950 [Chitinophagaceae bacterium]
MKKDTLLLFLFALIILQSCQKEVSKENGGASAAPSGTLLVRSVYKSGTDSSLTTYAYDGARRLTTLNNSGTTSGAPYNTQIKIVRNTSGIIQKMNIKSDQFAQLGIDSLVYVVNYDLTTGRYKSKVFTVDFLVVVLKDSTSYDYDASGKVIRDREFTDDGTAGGYEEVGKTEYTYAGNNIATVKIFSYDVPSNTYTLNETDTYEYDAKTNALQLGNEAFLLGDVSFYGANNVSKLTINVPADPASNQVHTTTYTYNSNNRPLIATVLMQPGGTTTTSFTYQ